MNPSVDLYLAEGCGRCPLGGTPACKVHSWTEELVLLRGIMLTSGLEEALKWKVPTYTFEQRNIAIVSAFKDYASLSFFKGALLPDPHGLLEKPGPNSQAARILKFTRAQDIVDREALIRTYVSAAIAVEQAGQQIDFREKHELVYPAELEQRFGADPVFQTAFEALTPGRQRGYILYFTAPKQSQTRASRIEKCIPDILAGKGMHD
ncbi:MAG: YdeI family protein [Bacteroidia bacterium]